MSVITIQLNSQGQGDSAVRAASARLKKLCAAMEHEKNELLKKSDELRTRFTKLTRYTDSLEQKFRAKPDTETELLLRQGRQLTDTCAQLMRYASEQIAYAQKGAQFIGSQSYGLEQLLCTHNQTDQKLAELIRRYGAIHAVRLV